MIIHKTLQAHLAKGSSAKYTEYIDRKASVEKKEMGNENTSDIKKGNNIIIKNQEMDNVDRKDDEQFDNKQAVCNETKSKEKESCNGDNRNNKSNMSNCKQSGINDTNKSVLQDKAPTNSRDADSDNGASMQLVD